MLRRFFYAACACLICMHMYAADVQKNSETCFTAVFSEGECALHPHRAYSITEAQIMTALYEGLFVYDPATLEPLPGYAESWSVSDDKRQWTIQLRKDGTFSNGDPVTADVFVESWKALLAPALNAPYASMLDFIVGAESFRAGTGTTLGVSAVDAYTLQIDLTMTVDYLPKVLCHYAFSAVHKSMLNLLPDSVIAVHDVIASGAYVPVSYGGGTLKMSRNEKYWDVQNVAVPRIVITFSDDQAAAVDMFNKGKVQWLESNVDVASIVQKNAIKLIPSFSTEFFFFRCDISPWNSAPVRSLLVSALPWSKIRSDFLIPAKTLVFPLSGYPELRGIEDGEELDVDAFRADLETAAGMKTSEFPDLVISIPQADHLFKIASEMKAVWESAGLTVRIEQMSVRDYYDGKSDPATAVKMMSWVGDYADPLAFLELFRPTSALNDSHWNNPQFDPLLKRASRQKTQEKRYEMLGKAEQLIIDDGVIMPISFRPSLNAIDDDIVQGWASNVLDIHPFKFLKIVPRKPVPNMI